MSEWNYLELMEWQILDAEAIDNIYEVGRLKLAAIDPITHYTLYIITYNIYDWAR